MDNLWIISGNRRVLYQCNHGNSGAVGGPTAKSLNRKLSLLNQVAESSVEPKTNKGVFPLDFGCTTNC